MLISSFGLAHVTRLSESIELKLPRLGGLQMCRKPTLRGFGGGKQWLFQFGDSADRIGKIKVGAKGNGGSVWIGWFSSLF